MLAGIPAGCSELTSVDTVDVVEPSDLANRLGAQALRAGAIGDFTNAFVGGPFSQVLISGRISDEFFAADPNDIYDRRDMPEIDPLPNVGPFLSLAAARISLLQAIAALRRFDPQARGQIAELYALLAYIALFFGENFCAGVPLSSVVNGQPEYGEQLSTTEMLERSIASFDSAIAYASSDPRVLNLARVGRARALLHWGNFGAAALAVEDVPTTFAYETSHAATLQPNFVWTYLSVERRATVAEREGHNGLDFVTAKDPRVATRLIGFGRDGHTPIYAPEKYLSATSPVVLASGIEARLVESEAFLNLGDPQGALAKLNDLRAVLPDLDELAFEQTDAERVTQVFRERAFWLFATGHRHGDMRRLVRQYGRNPESVFPTGTYKEGLDYGRAVTLGINALERKNPHFGGGCFSRDA